MSALCSQYDMRNSCLSRPRLSESVDHGLSSYVRILRGMIFEHATQVDSELLMHTANFGVLGTNAIRMIVNGDVRRSHKNSRSLSLPMMAIMRNIRPS